MPFVPAHEVVTSSSETAPARCAFLLHGILGSRRNWLSFARSVVVRFPRWRVVLVDLRNHGESHGAPPPHDVGACARDLAELAAHLGEEPRLVVGHSFGGKVALVYARDHAAALDEVWVLDANPGAGSSRAEGAAASVEAVFDAVARVPLPITGRASLVAELRARGLPLAIARWMTTNLRPLDEGGFGWRFDLEACREMLRSYAAVDAWGVLERPPSGVRPVVVRGGRSDRWSSDDVERLQRLSAAGAIGYEVLEAAGHWLHTDDLGGLLRLLSPSLEVRDG